MAKSLSLEDVKKRLKKHDRRFRFFTNRGKGSHQIIFHEDIDGQPVSCPIPSHKGRDISKGVLGSIKRAFKLPKDIFQ